MNLCFLGFRERDPFLSGALRSRPLFVRPPQPPHGLVFSNPSRSVLVSRCRTWAVPFCWSFEKMANPHVAVVGMTGSGKSYFVKTFLTRCNLVYGTHAFILDWSGEYAEWVRQAGGTVLSLGGQSLNLLDLGGMTPSQRCQQVLEALKQLTDLKHFPREQQWVRLALEQSYVLRRFAMDRGSDKKPPTLKDALYWLKAKAKKAAAWDRREIENAVLLLRPLTVSGSDFFAKPSSFSLDKILASGLVCVDLTALSSEAFRSLAGLTLLQFMREKMRVSQRHDRPELKWWVVLDEAWKICGEDGDPVAIVREGRKYAFGLLVASQNPTDVHPAIFSNVASLFMFRTTFSDSLDYLQKTLRFSDTVRSGIAGLGVGECAVQAQWAGHAQADALFLEKVDGEALLAPVRVRVAGMEYGFDKAEFCRRLLAQDVSKANVDELREWLSRNPDGVDAVDLAVRLESASLSPEGLHATLCWIGLTQEHVSFAFAHLAQKRLPAGTSVVEAVFAP